MELTNLALPPSSQLKVMLTTIEDPLDFFCQVVSSDLDILMSQIKEHCEKEQHVEAEKAELFLGGECLTRYPQDDEWYRGKVTGILKSGEVEILFVDYGNREYMRPGSQLRMPAKFFKLPIQGFDAYLDGQAFRYLEDWPEDDVTLFRSKTEDFVLTAMIKHFDTDLNRYAIDLYNKNELVNTALADSTGRLKPGYIPLRPSSGEERILVGRPAPSIACKEIADLSLEVGDVVLVYVAYHRSPSQFWVHLAKNNSDIDLMMEELEMDAKSSLPISSVKEGQFCMAKYSGDSNWYRSKILSCGSGMARTLFVDYGNEEEVPLIDIRELPPQSYSMPCQAIPCRLFGVVPKDSAHWSSEADEFFSSMTNDKVLTVVVLSKEDDYVVELMQNDGKKETQIADLLITKGHAADSQSCGNETPPIDHPSPASWQLKSHNRAEVVQAQKYRVERLEKGKSYTMSIEHIQSSGKVFCQLVKRAPELESMMKLLDDECRNLSLAEQQLRDPTAGVPCCCEYAGDRSWYRAVVLQVEMPRVQVMYVDYGNEEWVEADQLKSLSSAFLDVPRQAHKICVNVLDTAQGKSYLEKVSEEGNVVVTIETVSMNSYTASLTQNGESVSKKLESFSANAGAGDWHPPGRPVVLLDSFVIGQEYACCLTKVVSPLDCWIQMTAMTDRLNELINRMTYFYNKLAASERVLAGPAVGSPCALLYRNDDKWYRARVEKVRDARAKVRYVDYGNIEVRHLKELKQLDERFAELPVQAARCCLDGVVGAGIDDPSKLEWSTDTLNLFHELDTQMLKCKMLRKEGDILIVKLTSESGRDVGSNCRYSLPGATEGEAPRAGAIQPSASEAVPCDHMAIARAQGAIPKTLRSPPASAQTLPTSPPGRARKISLLERMELDGSTFNMFCSAVDNLGSFFLQLEGSDEKLESFAVEMNLSYESGSVRLSSPARGDVCACPYSLDGSWYRTVIRSVEGDQASVNFLDYGNYDVVPLDELCELKEEFASRPLLAVECFLPGRPVDDPAEEFVSLIQDCLLHVEILNHAANPVPVLVVTQNGENLNKMFICGETKTAEPVALDIYPPRGSFPKNAPIIIAHVETTRQFYIQFESEMDNLQQIADSLNEVYSEMQDSDNVLKFPQRYSPCVAVYSEDGNFYRGLIEFIDSGVASVRFVDYGNTELIKITDLKVLLPAFLVQTFAVCVQLAGNGDGSESAKLRKISENGECSVVCRMIDMRAEPPIIKMEIDNQSADLLLNLTPSRTDWPTPSVDECSAEHLEQAAMGMPILQTTSNASFKLDNPILNQNVNASVIISHVDSIKQAYLQFESDLDSLQCMSDQLNAEYTAMSADDHRLADGVVGDYCVAKYAEDDCYYRGIIESVDKGTADVRFVDYGNKETVKLELLKKLLPTYHKAAYAVCVQVIDLSDEVLDNFNMEVADVSNKFTVDFEDITVSPMKVRLKINDISASQIFSIEKEATIPSSSITVSSVQLEPAGTHEFSQFAEPVIQKNVNAEVMISHVESAKQFYVQFQSDIDDLAEMAEALHADYCAITDDSRKLTTPTVSLPCVAVFADDGFYYRGVIEDLNDDKATVRFIDYGNSTVVPVDQLRKVVECYQRPAYSICVQMKEECEDSVTENLKLACDDDSNCFTIDFEDISTSPITINLKINDKTARQFFGSSVHLDFVPENECVSAGGGSAAPERKESNIEKDADMSKPSDAVLAAIHENRSVLDEIGDVEALRNGSKHEVYVAHVSTVAQFFCQRAVDVEQIESFMTKLDDHCKNDDTALEIVAPGLICAACYEDENWYRARVISQEGNNVSVYFIDYGNTETVDIENLKTLPSDIAGLPPFAFECTFDELEEVSIDQNNADMFRDIMEDKKLLATIVSSSLKCDGELRYVVVLRDVGLNVLELLKDSNSCPPVPPPPPSPEDDCASATAVIAPVKTLLFATETEPVAADAVLDPLTFPRKSKQEVVISKINSPSSFWVTLASATNVTLVMSSLIREACCLLEPISELSVGRLCLYSPPEGLNMRAQLFSLEPLEVIFLDDGSQQFAEANHIFPMISHFMTPPAQAVLCSLSDCRPFCTVWSSQASQTFQRLTEHKKLIARIDSLTEESPVLVKLLDMGMSISDKLIEQSFGKHVHQMGHVPTQVDHSLPEVWTSESVKRPQCIEEANLSPSNSTSESEDELTEVAVGDYCLAQPDAPSASFYRARVTGVRGALAEIFYLDYGYIDTIRKNRLQRLSISGCSGNQSGKGETESPALLFPNQADEVRQDDNTSSNLKVACKGGPDEVTKPSNKDGTAEELAVDCFNDSGESVESYKILNSREGFSITDECTFDGKKPLNDDNFGKEDYADGTNGGASDACKCNNLPHEIASLDINNRLLTTDEIGLVERLCSDAVEGQTTDEIKAAFKVDSAREDKSCSNNSLTEANTTKDNYNETDISQNECSESDSVNLNDSRCTDSSDMCDSDEANTSKNNSSESYASKNDSSESDTSKNDPSEANTSKNDPSEANTSKNDSSEANTSKNDSSDMSKNDSDEANTSKSDSYESDTSTNDSSELDTSKNESNEANTSTNDSSELDTSKNESNEANTSTNDSSELDTSKNESNEANTSTNDSSELDTSKNESNDTNASMNDCSDSNTSKNESSDSNTSENDCSDSNTSKNDSSDSNTSKNDSSDSNTSCSDSSDKNSEADTGAMNESSAAENVSNKTENNLLAEQKDTSSSEHTDDEGAHDADISANLADLSPLIDYQLDDEETDDADETPTDDETASLKDENGVAVTSNSTVLVQNGGISNLSVQGVEPSDFSFYDLTQDSDKRVLEIQDDKHSGPDDHNGVLIEEKGENRSEGNAAVYSPSDFSSTSDHVLVDQGSCPVDGIDFTGETECCNETLAYEENGHDSELSLYIGFIDNQNAETGDQGTECLETSPTEDAGDQPEGHWVNYCTSDGSFLAADADQHGNSSHEDCADSELLSCVLETKAGQQQCSSNAKDFLNEVVEKVASAKGN